MQCLMQTGDRWVCAAFKQRKKDAQAKSQLSICKSVQR